MTEEYRVDELINARGGPTHRMIPIEKWTNLNDSHMGMIATLCGIEEALGNDSSNLARNLACEMGDGAYLIEEVKKLKANQRFVKDNALADIRSVTDTLRLVLKSVADDDISYTLGDIISTLERITNDG